MTASSRLAEKRYTVKGRVVDRTPATLQIQYTTDSLSDKLELKIIEPVTVKTGEDLRVCYIMKDQGPVLHSIVRTEAAPDPEG